MHERGWLQKQFESAAEEVKAWPAWMQKVVAQDYNARLLPPTAQGASRMITTATTCPKCGGDGTIWESIEPTYPSPYANDTRVVKCPACGGSGSNEVQQSTALFVGQRAIYTKTLDPVAIFHMRQACGDDNPIHWDKPYAARTRFERPICHGMLVASLISTVLGTKLPGPGTIYLSQRVEFWEPVFVGETVEARVEVVELQSTHWPEQIIAVLDTVCWVERDGVEVKVVSGEASVLVEGVEREG